MKFLGIARGFNVAREPFSMGRGNFEGAWFVISRTQRRRANIKRQKV